MSPYYEDVDRYSRESLQEWEVLPPGSVEEKVRRRMFWTNLRRRHLNKVILLGLLLLIGTGTATYFFWIGSHKTTGQWENRSRETVAVQNDPSSSFLKQDAHTPENKNDKSTPLLTKDVFPSIASSTDDPLNNEVISDPIFLPDPVNTMNTEPELAFSQTDPSSLQEAVWSEKPEENTSLFEEDASVPFTTIIDESADSYPNFSMNLIKKIEVPIPLQREEQHHFPIKGNTPRYAFVMEATAQLPGLHEKREGIRSSPLMPSYSIALKGQVFYKRWFLESGLQYTQLQTRQEADRLTYHPRDIVEQILIGQQLDIDTSGYWHIKYIQDSTIHPYDSVWVTEYDSSYADTYEDQLSTIYDTLAGPTWSTGVSLLEVPIGFGYQWSLQNWGLEMKAGLLLSIWQQTSGSTYIATSTNGLIPMNEVYHKKGMQCSYYLSLGLSRQITEKWSLTLSPAYRESLIGLKGDEGILEKKYRSFGIGIGAKMSF